MSNVEVIQNLDAENADLDRQIAEAEGVELGDTDAPPDEITAALNVIKVHDVPTVQSVIDHLSDWIGGDAQIAAFDLKTEAQTVNLASMGLDAAMLATLAAGREVERAKLASTFRKGRGKGIGNGYKRGSLSALDKAAFRAFRKDKQPQATPEVAADLFNAERSMGDKINPVTLVSLCK